MRGENRLSFLEEKHGKGSPPHAWGKQILMQCYYAAGGITPTCVGKTIQAGVCANTRGDHPHMRGENRYLVYVEIIHMGSPPHAWGKLPLCAFFLRGAGITPTCVGKTG